MSKLQPKINLKIFSNFGISSLGFIRDSKTGHQNQ